MKKFILVFTALFFTRVSTAQLYYADVAATFHDNCGHCHNTNSHGPSLLTYSAVMASISDVETHLLSGYMPPWMPDTTYTRFCHENVMSAAARQLILDWITGGALAGDTTLAPPPPVYSPYHLNGTPDLELQIPTFTSNAVSDDSYVCFSLPSGLTTDRIVRAYEVIAGNHEIVHHVILNVDTTGTVTSDLSGTCYTPSGQYDLGGYAPGAEPTVFPNSSVLKMGIRIKAGSNIILQIHYPLGTAGEVDSTKVRFYFYPEGEPGVRPVHVETPIQNWLLNIPAETIQTFSAQSASISGPVSVYATFPHSHKLATDIVNYAYSGSDTIPLVRINNWDFNWQGYYTFKNMVKVPAGYKFKGTHVYDNTSSNPFNPSSPPVNVYAGTSTNDEMLFDSFMWIDYQAGDELIDIDSILENDPLLVGVNQIYTPASNSMNAFAYPNPFNNAVNISYELERASMVSINIVSVTGKLVRSIQHSFENEGKHEVVWDGKNNLGNKLSNGTYFYTIKTNSSVFTGKVMLMNGK
ncbi:MAG TPA: FlgD immunoglobulin-like domain containing protein [Flavobacteriales bacterium]|nr:FlgD immunoglobulin-like domain containing protein [Flavobacteriales bacterium]